MPAGDRARHAGTLEQAAHRGQTCARAAFKLGQALEKTFAGEEYPAVRCGEPRGSSELPAEKGPLRSSPAGTTLALPALMTRGPRSLASLTLALALVPAAAAHAQRVEVGSSLINVTVTTDDENVTMVGIPSGGFGLLSPSGAVALTVSLGAVFGN